MQQLNGNPIRKVNQQFEEAWNRGDLVAACEAYAEDATILSLKRGVIHGKKAIVERYQKDYPDRPMMGTLRATLIESRWGGKMGSAIWHWTIDTQDGIRVEGHNLEVYEKRGERVYIVQDATITTESV